MADINKEASWVTARLLEVGNATNDGANVLLTDANIQYYNAGGLANTLGINKGGTGATDAAGARTNLGVPSTGDVTSAINTAVASKADKVTGATSGNFAGLDANGDLMDSGSKASDFIPALASGATPGDIAVIGSNNNIVDSGKSLADLYDAAMIHKTASGSIVTIENGADDVPIKSMTAQIAPVQDGSGDPSPSNVRAISGWTGAKIKRHRRNLLNNTSTGDQHGGIVMTRNSDGSYHISGTASASITTRLAIKGSSPLYFPYGTYTVSVNSDFAGTGTSTYRMYFEYYNSADGAWNGITMTSNTTSRTVTTVGIRNFRLQIYQSTALDITIKPQIEVGSVAHAFESYITDCDTYEIAFPSEAGTVYGGELTVNEDGTGTLTASYAKRTFTGQETLSGTVSGGINFNTAYWGTSLTMKPGTYYTDDKVKISKLPKVNVSTGLGMLIGSNNHYMYIYHADQISGVTDIDTFRTWLTGLEVTYPLNVPVTYQLTAEQMTTLLGLNNIWADTGDISVTYRADPTLAIAEQAQAIRQSIAPVEDGYTASQAYAVGSYLYVGNTLYVVTSEIASGATITPGTNVSEEPLADGVTGLSEWENAAITVNSTYLTSANALYCRVNQKLKIAVLFGWFTIGTIPSPGATLFTITGIKPVNSYCYTYAHRGASIISMRPTASGSNTNVNVDIGTSGSMATGAHALQIAVIPIQ